MSTEQEYITVFRFSACVVSALVLWPLWLSFSHIALFLDKGSWLSRWSALFYPESLSYINSSAVSACSLFSSYLGFWCLPYLDVILSLVMPRLFIILFLQGTDSFSLFKFDLLTFPLPCNLAIVWVVLSMKDMRCQVITLYYSLRCQRPVGKLHLTCHYFCQAFAC